MSQRSESNHATRKGGVFEVLKKITATASVKAIKMQTKKTIDQLRLERNRKSREIVAAREL